MCQFVILLCLKCGSSRRPRLLPTDMSTDGLTVFEEVSCGYWYCDALRNEAPSYVQPGHTCGDQLCEVHFCSANVVSRLCCTDLAPKDQAYRRIHSAPPSLASELYIEPYLIPVLTRRQLLLILCDIVTDTNSEVELYFNKLLTCENYNFYFTTYYLWNGVSARKRYQVEVERQQGEAHPQFYEGSLVNFLKLRKLFRRQRMRRDESASFYNGGVGEGRGDLRDRESNSSVDV